MLCDHQIKTAISGGSIFMSPFDPELVQPASVDLRLGAEFIQYNPGDRAIDPESPDPSQWQVFRTEEFVLHPGIFVLGTTMERIELADSFAARVEGKSTLGRLGLIIHSTAGFVDPGFKGNITLEMTNINSRSIILRSGMKICQIAFEMLNTPPERPYGHSDLGSHYQDQQGVAAAKSLSRSTLFS